MSILVYALALGGLVRSAEAQSLSDAEARMEEADFSGAISVFDELEQTSTGLSRSELAALYAGRAAAHLALGANDQMEADLQRMVAVDPTFELADTVRPEISDAFARLVAAGVEPLSVDASARAEGDDVLIEARVSGDRQALTRQTRVFGRPVGDEWLSEVGSLLVPSSSSSIVEYYAVAVGPGGAVLASAGSVGSPLSFALERGPNDGGTDGGGGDDLTWLWITLGVAGLAAAVVTIVAVVVASASSDATQPGAPIIFPMM